MIINKHIKNIYIYFLGWFFTHGTPLRALRARQLPLLFTPTQTFRPKRMLTVIILNRMNGTPNNVGTCKTSWELQPIRLSRPGVMCVCGPNNVRRSVQRIQHCCATLRRSRSKRKVGSRWLKSLTGFKLCATTRNNTQQHATGCGKGCNV